MKIALLTILLLTALSFFAQNSGTFKVVKKETPTESRNRGGSMFVGTRGVFGGKSTPEKARSYSVLAGFDLDLRGNNKYVFTLGVTGGYAHPTEKYKGITVGVFASYDYALSFGSRLVYIPLEFSYKKLINSLDYKSLNQFTVTSGLGIPVNRISGTSVYLLGNYIYERNSMDTFNGIYLSIGVDYRF